MRVILAAVLVVVSAVFAFPADARAEVSANSLVVSGSLDPDGTLHVIETFSFSDSAPKIVQRLENSTPALDYANYEFEIFDITALASGSDLGAAVEKDGNYTVITVDGAKAGQRPIEIKYSVKGAAYAGASTTGGDTLTELRWRVVQGLNIAIDEVSGEIATGTAPVRDFKCLAGAPAALVSCQTFSASTYESPFPSFTNGALGAGQVIQVGVKVPEKAVAANEKISEEWTLDRAFSAKLPYLLSALIVALLGSVGLWLLYRLRGRDMVAVTTPKIVAAFEPKGEGIVAFELKRAVRPGMVGTLTDERVDPVDITATVLDLAQRGHLVIRELPRESEHASVEWRLERSDGHDELLDYEQKLLDLIVPAGVAPVKLSTMVRVLASSITEIQDSLYDEVVKRGWFVSRPDQTRTTYYRLGVGGVIIGLIALVMLVAFTKFGLVGLVWLGLSIGLLFIAQGMPKRSARGSAVLQGLQLLALQLHTQPTDQFDKSDAYEQISSILPYATVLGSQQRWLQALADADDDPGVPDPDDLSWYKAPDTWNLSDLPSCLDQFTTALEGKLYSRG